MPSSSRRSRSRSHCETSFPAPILRPLPSPASVPRSGSTPPTSRPFTMLSSPTATPSSPHRSTAPSAAPSPSPAPRPTRSLPPPAPDRQNPAGRRYLLPRGLDSGDFRLHDGRLGAQHGG